MKLKSQAETKQYTYKTELFDLQYDPQRLNPINDVKAEKRMIKLMRDLMIKSSCPKEQFERLGI